MRNDFYFRIAEQRPADDPGRSGRASSLDSARRAASPQGMGTQDIFLWIIPDLLST